MPPDISFELAYEFTADAIIILTGWDEKEIYDYPIFVKILAHIADIPNKETYDWLKMPPALLIDTALHIAATKGKEFPTRQDTLEALASPDPQDPNNPLPYLLNAMPEFQGTIQPWNWDLALWNVLKETQMTTLRENPSWLSNPWIPEEPP